MSLSLSLLLLLLLLPSLSFVTGFSELSGEYVAQWMELNVICALVQIPDFDFLGARDYVLMVKKGLRLARGCHYNNFKLHVNFI
jgi:hypothetical protein